MTDAGAEHPIGTEDVALLPHDLAVSVCPDLQVRVRIRGADRQLLADIATSPASALRIAELFRAAALRADPSLATRDVRSLEARK